MQNIEEFLDDQLAEGVSGKKIVTQLIDWLTDDLYFVQQVITEESKSKLSKLAKSLDLA